MTCRCVCHGDTGGAEDCNCREQGDHHVPMLSDEASFDGVDYLLTYMQGPPYLWDEALSEEEINIVGSYLAQRWDIHWEHPVDLNAPGMHKKLFEILKRRG